MHSKSKVVVYIILLLIMFNNHYIGQSSLQKHVENFQNPPLDSGLTQDGGGLGMLLLKKISLMS